MAYFQARTLRLHCSLYALKGDIDSLYEYMRALATQELNPMIIPPDILKKILHKVTEDIKSNARLRLSEDPKTNIWAYYGNAKLTPIILQDYLMLILTVPLVDQSLQMELYKVYISTHVTSYLTCACSICDQWNLPCHPDGGYVHLITLHLRC